jgi:hypothetical protein
MFCGVTVRDVQPEIRPEVTRKVCKALNREAVKRRGLRGKMREFFGKPAFAKTSGVAGRGLPGCHGLGALAADWVIRGTRMRSRFYVNESSFRLAAETSRLAACAPQSGSRTFRCHKRKLRIKAII